MLRRVTIQSTSEDTEHLEISCTTVWNIKWYNPLGNNLAVKPSIAMLLRITKA